MWAHLDTPRGSNPMGYPLGSSSLVQEAFSFCSIFVQHLEQWVLVSWLWLLLSIVIQIMKNKNIPFFSQNCCFIGFIERDQAQKAGGEFLLLQKGLSDLSSPFGIVIASHKLTWKQPFAVEVGNVSAWEATFVSLSVLRKRIHWFGSLKKGKSCIQIPGLILDVWVGWGRRNLRLHRKKPVSNLRYFFTFKFKAYLKIFFTGFNKEVIRDGLYVVPWKMIKGDKIF